MSAGKILNADHQEVWLEGKGCVDGVEEDADGEGEDKEVEPIKEVAGKTEGQEIGIGQKEKEEETEAEVKTETKVTEIQPTHRWGTVQ